MPVVFPCLKGPISPAHLQRIRNCSGFTAGNGCVNPGCFFLASRATDRCRRIPAGLLLLCAKVFAVVKAALGKVLDSDVSRETSEFFVEMTGKCGIIAASGYAPFLLPAVFCRFGVKSCLPVCGPLNTGMLPTAPVTTVLSYLIVNRAS